MTSLGDRFERALQFAASLHRHQKRKGTSTPYIAHLLAVTALVLEHGGDEDQAVAALLHDAAEDQGGQETLAAIREQFGDRVARMVEELSDTFQTPKPPWKRRKEAYLAHLPEAGEDTLLISVADKLHNARSILQDLSISGDAIWQRFNGGKDGVLWYYRALADFFLGHRPDWLAEELDRVVSQIEALAEKR